MIVYLGKETANGGVDMSAPSSVGVRVAGYKLMRYSKGGSANVIGAAMFHKSETVDTAGFDNNEGDKALGEYKVALFLGPRRIGEEPIVWRSIV